jgi:hypothetical protein
MRAVTLAARAMTRPAAALSCAARTGHGHGAAQPRVMGGAAAVTDRAVVVMLSSRAAVVTISQ